MFDVNGMAVQGVMWVVMNEPSFLGKRQLDEFRRSVALYPGSKVRDIAVCLPTALACRRGGRTNVLTAYVAS